MLDAGEEEGEADGGRMDQHDNDNDGGEEEGGDCNNVHGPTISMCVVAGVTNSRSCFCTISSNGPSQLLLLLLTRTSLYLQLLPLAVNVVPPPLPLPLPIVVVIVRRSPTLCGNEFRMLLTPEVPHV
jgi:hypothetical protein